MITLTLLCGFAAGAFFGWLWMGERMYREGKEYGQREQLAADRGDIVAATIAKARAEQLADTWARRARALLHAHFGPEREP
jgi:hypothetical protein